MVAGNAEGDGLSLASAADSSPDGVCDGLGGDGHFAFGGRDGQCTSPRNPSADGSADERTWLIQRLSIFMKRFFPASVPFIFAFMFWIEMNFSPSAMVVEGHAHVASSPWFGRPGSATMQARYTYLSYSILCRLVARVLVFG